MDNKYTEELNKKFLQLKQEITHLLSNVNRNGHSHLQNYIFLLTSRFLVLQKQC